MADALQCCAEVNTEAVCRACPTGASCNKGEIALAQKDRFLVAAPSGALLSYECPSGFCLDARLCYNDNIVGSSVNGSNATTGVSLSCCASNRLPAVDEHGNVNLLCRACAVGLQQVALAGLLLVTW